MDVSTVDIAKYPFLPEAASYVKSQNINIGEFIESASGRVVVMDTRDFIVASLHQHLIEPHPIESNDRVITMHVLKYPMVRILLSLINNQYITTRTCDAYADLMGKYLAEERTDMVKHVVRALQLPYPLADLPVTTYVPLCVPLAKQHTRWKLVNRSITKGIVSIPAEDRLFLMKVQISKQIKSKIPGPVNPYLAELLKPVTTAILDAWKEHTGTGITGPIEPGRYPPCIKHIIASINANAPVSHPARFTLATFMKGIGMTDIDVARIFMQGSGDVAKTQYQLSHIMTEHDYICPACATLLSNGVCPGKDKLCNSVKHPLNYYARKKRLT